MAAIHISLRPEEIADIAGFHITNSMLTTWLVMIVLVGVSIAGTQQLRLVPGYFQSILEMIVEGLWNTFEGILHDKTKVFFPLLATLFLFILTMNWSGLLPGVGTIGYFHEEEFAPIFRSGTADLNTTIALALVVVVIIQITGFRALGLGYLKKFFNFSGPMDFFVGILELISELSRILSFAFRLFGNVFAGEVLITVIAFFMPVIAPLPLQGFEIFVGFIQAFVFSMLTAVYLSVAMTHAEH